MLPLVLTSPGALLRQIARRAVTRRLALGWTRDELARRSGVAPDTLKRFEQTGHVSLERLLKIAVALDAVAEFGGLFPPPEAASLAELDALAAVRRRQRGRLRGTRRGVRAEREGADREPPEETATTGAGARSRRGRADDQPRGPLRPERAPAPPSADGLGAVRATGAGRRRRGGADAAP